MKLNSQSRFYFFLSYKEWIFLLDFSFFFVLILGSEVDLYGRWEDKIFKEFLASGVNAELGLLTECNTLLIDLHRNQI